MKVILSKAVPGLGEPGQVVHAKDGYARNYLIPQGFGRPATGQNMKSLDNLKAFKQKRSDRFVKAAEETSAKLAGLTLIIAKPVGEEDRIHGTVTAMEIADALAAKGLEIDRRIIHIGDPIKSLGTFTVNVKLHAQVQVPLTVEVVKE